MEENKRISDLFERARNEAPRTSFDDMKSNFLTAGAVGATGIIAKWIAASFKLKVIIMVVSFSTLVISGLIISAQLGSTTKHVEVKADEKREAEIEYIEVSNLGGIKKTVIFDENDQVLKVMIDSAKKVSPMETTTAKSESETDGAELMQQKEVSKNQLIELKKNEPIGLIKKDSLNDKVFTITEKTTNEELDKIAEQALAVGITFDYSARFRGNSIRKVNLDMKIDKTGNSSDFSASVSGETFSYTFGWFTDESGKPVGFIWNENIRVSY